MHLALMLVIQCMYVLVQLSGTNLVWPFSTASMAGPASTVALHHHCIDKSGSMMMSER